MSQTVNYSGQLPPRRLSKAALWSLIFGILGCIPFLSGILAILLGVVGFIAGGGPDRRGRWMAVVGMLLGVMSLAAWILFGGAIWGAASVGSKVVAAMKAPGDATHDFIMAAASGDEAGEKAHAAMDDKSRKDAEDMIRAQGSFIDSTFNQVNINEGGSAHVEGTARFQSAAGPVKTLHVKADLTEVDGKWKVESTELLPAD